jgi:hypothetical protein
MSKIENPKIVLKKTLFPGTLDHNALIFILHDEKTVMLIFRIFFEKFSELFSVGNI